MTHLAQLLVGRRSVVQPPPALAWMRPATGQLQLGTTCHELLTCDGIWGRQKTLPLQWGASPEADSCPVSTSKLAGAASSKPAAGQEVRVPGRGPAARGYHPSDRLGNMPGCVPLAQPLLRKT